MAPQRIETVEVLLPCEDLEQTLAFFVEELGFRLESLHPAEEPRVARLAGHGTRLALERGAAGDPGRLRLTTPDVDAPTERVAPNGTRLLLEPARLVVPPLAASLVVTHAGDTPWTLGRAGMRYRDLVPDRQGGRFVASHIRIEEEGPVDDWVHHHRIAFQVLCCRRGWVRVAYQDQGEPFVLREGDAVLQPPGIRHRVLEASAGLEVVEVASPAVHETHADPELKLPNGTLDRERRFEGQRFGHHVARDADWGPSDLAGFEARASTFDADSGGRVALRHLRRTPGAEQPGTGTHRHELRLWFVVAGSATLDCGEAGRFALAPDDACCVPAGLEHRLEPSDDLALLEIVAPA